ncbi:NAD-dependent epimerase/dehydratase family protein [Microcoleus sp. CAWBG640]|uniref:NAD-dependent epimerase/dehydratase family protein n=1 Tax=Microcoleus sp. CAWBG640 TaxID=2841653 RepID=UPI00312BA15D
MFERVLIVGGAGFIGSCLAIGLKKLHPELQIICLDNLRRRGSELNLPRLKSSGIEFVYGDIRTAADLDPVALNVDCIIDCAAEPSVLAGFSSPQYVLQTNLLGTVNVLELARQTGASLLFLSTSRVYPIATVKSIKLLESESRFAIAPNQTIPGISELGISEDFPLKGNRSLYGATKLASELLIEEYRAAYNVPAIINRCGLITGAWQMGKVDQGVCGLWVAAHYFQKSLNYIGFGGSGKQVRDLLHVEDLLRLVNYQLENFAEFDGEVFNVGGGCSNSLSLIETTDLCQKITGKSIPIHPVLEERAGDIPIFITDSSRVMERTGWQPRISPEAALQDIYEWIVANEIVLSSIL